MKAEKLPSGNYRVRVYDKETGRRGSFTAPSKKEAERQAAAWYLQHRSITGMTFGSALERYISDREAILKPSTRREYRRCQKLFPQFDDMPLDRIRDEDIQRYLNEKSKKLSPKSVKNLNGIISAVFRTYAPNRRLVLSCPKIYPKDEELPTEEEIGRLLGVSEGRHIEAPILLAVFCGLRRGEIAALHPEDISSGWIHIHHALSLSEDNEYIETTPKTVSGDRFCPVPDFVAAKALDYLAGHPLAPQGLESGYLRAQKAAWPGKHFRFHLLRHYCASMMHAKGVPDIYIMRWLGWNDDHCLKNIYRHKIAEEEQKHVASMAEYAAAAWEVRGK